MQFHIITIFPEWFTSPLATGLLQKAQDKAILSFCVHNLRDYAPGKHRSTDDTPYGGGWGMVMNPEPLVNAIEAVSVSLNNPRRIFLSPQGQPLSQAKAAELAAHEALVLVCGRYEGVDERVLAFVDEEISIGDYIVSGGEVAALVLIDTVARLMCRVWSGGKSQPKTSLSVRDCSNIHSIPGRKSFAVCRFQTCCYPVIMRTSPGGDADSRLSGPAHAGRTCSKRLT